MNEPSKQIVSMLVSSDKITLFTILGEIIEIKNDDDYDTAKISEYLTPKLTGTSAVELNLSNYSRITQILPTDLEDEGIIITQIINGREVQGIFYPCKVGVAVTVGEEKINIPDIENLTGHIKRAVDEKSPSVVNFLRRLATVLKDRKHSGEDLMKFIKLSEMPLTNNGRIIAYKRVNKSEGEYFQDCHTGLVKQRVGSRVIMKVDLVDPSRHESCSTGLHVANLGYMRGFSGSYTLIVLVNPEDFIAVPKGEDTKARVCAYDIIGVMSNNAHDHINTGSHVSDDMSLQQLIKNAVEGTTRIPFEQIEVGYNGVIVAVTPLTDQYSSVPVTSTSVSSGKSLNEDKCPDEPSRDALKVTRAAKSADQSIPEEVIEAFDKMIAGISKSQVAQYFVTSTRSIGRWMEKWNFDAYKQIAETPTAPPPDETSEIIENLAQKETPVNDENFAKLVQSSEAPKPVTKVEQMRKLFNNWVLGGKKETDLNAIKMFKSSAKKSYQALGLTDKEISSLTEN